MVRHLKLSPGNSYSKEEIWYGCPQETIFFIYRIQQKYVIPSYARVTLCWNKFIPKEEFTFRFLLFSISLLATI